jgi:hypothetical protein
VKKYKTFFHAFSKNAGEKVKKREKKSLFTDFTCFTHFRKKTKLHVRKKQTTFYTQFFAGAKIARFLTRFH